MNKYKFFIAFTFISLLCIGCNSNNDSHELICNISKDYNNQTITILFDDDNREVLNIKSKTIIDLSNLNEDFKNQLIDFSYEGCSNSGKKNCKVLVENNQVIEEYESTGELLFDTNKKPLDKVKEMFESDGFTCKK